MSKHHMHVMVPTKLNEWLEKQKVERGMSKTAVIIQLIEKAEAEDAKNE